MRTVPYDTSRDALYHPETGRSLFLTLESPSEELLCAEASRLAYKKFEKIPEERAAVERDFRRVGFGEVEFFDSEGTEAITAWNPDGQIALLAFRGTEQDPTDFIADLRAWKTDWRRGGKVHAGFAGALAKIWPAIDRWVEAHPGRLLMTGHSLGAALSTLAASLRTPSKLVTFGSPMVGDARFTETLAEIPTKIRFVDCCDVVCRVPPSLFGLEHVGALSYIDRSGLIQPDATDESMRQDRAAARTEYVAEHTWKRGAVSLRDLADHAPVNYIYSIQHASKDLA